MPIRTAFKKLEYTKTVGTSDTQSLKIITKNIDFGSAGFKIVMKKVYVTYEGNGSNMSLNYKSFSESGVGYPLNFTGSFTDASSNTLTAEFIPATKAQSKNLYSVQLFFNSSGSAIPMDFKIHDITIVYQKRAIK